MNIIFLFSAKGIHTAVETHCLSILSPIPTTHPLYPLSTTRTHTHTILPCLHSLPPQIYYAYRGFRIPMTYKSAEQQQLLLHLRHPIFLAPTLILWAVPVMTYDRLLVAIMLPLYLAWGSRIDYLDDHYVREQFRMKKSQLLASRKSN